MCLKLERGKHYPKSILGWFIFIGLIIFCIYIQQNEIYESDGFHFEEVCKDIFGKDCLKQIYKELLIILFVIICCIIINHIYHNSSKFQKIINDL